MFRKNDNQSSERVIFQTRPNLILGCKKAILGIILLIFVLFISGPIIKFIGNMQVYMISQIKLPITRYVAIAVFVVILIIILYIILQIIGWYSKEYLLTDSKIIVKSGIIFTRKNYMPYSTIQDINTSQSIFARLFNVGSISVFSAYDNNQIALENISEPSKVEEIIFSNMSRGPYHSREYYHMDSNNDYYQSPQQDFHKNSYNGHYQSPQQDYHAPSRQKYYQSSQQNYSPEYQENTEDYYPEDDYDDVDVITPIHQEEHYQRRQYDYYPDDLNYYESKKPKYEYEPYHENLEHNINRAINEEYDSYSNSKNSSYDDSYYNQENPNNHYSNHDYYDNSAEKFSYNEDVSNNSKSKKNDVDENSEKVIKRHFDKFKR